MSTPELIARLMTRVSRFHGFLEVSKKSFVFCRSACRPVNAKLTEPSLAWGGGNL